MFKLIDFSFGYKKLLFDKINIEIDASQITLINGANGCGKTTLLRVMSGLIKNYNGSIFLKNNEIKDMSVEEISNHIVYQKQEPMANIVAATPYEDLQIWLSKFLTSDIDSAKVNNALQRFGMNEVKDYPVWKLSGGQLKRAGLASLLLFPQKFWLVDEPTAGLDADLQSALLKILLQKKKSGVGAVIVTHRIDLFKNIADNIIQVKDKDLKI